MVYDSARGVTVLFGGHTTADTGNAETWEGEQHHTHGTFDVSIGLEQTRRNGVKTDRGMGMSLGGPDASLDALFPADVVASLDLAQRGPERGRGIGGGVG